MVKKYHSGKGGFVENLLITPKGFSGGKIFKGGLKGEPSVTKKTKKQKKIFSKPVSRKKFH